jgi:NodT family efflux transporter outer membrane factor (OMF) lipoprotein
LRRAPPAAFPEDARPSLGAPMVVPAKLVRKTLEMSPSNHIAIAFLLVGSACTVGPDFVKPSVRVNAGWREQRDGRLTTQGSVQGAWWLAFNDPILNQLIDIAYHQNLPLQIAGLRILESRAQLGIATGRQYPSNPGPIGAASIGGLNEHAANGDNVNVFFGKYQMGFDAIWEVDFWGKYRRGVRGAKASYLATVADYDDALVSITAEVARTYALVRTFQSLIELARENVTLQQDAQQIADSRFRNGATSELDVVQATTLLETTRASIPELEISLQQTENALCTLLGQQGGCADSLLGKSNSPVPGVTAPIAVSVPAELLRRRPDIRSAELRAVAQCDRIGMAKADLFPKLQLLGSLGTQGLALSAGSSALSSLLGAFSTGSLLYSIGASLFWPILSYPVILNNVRVQDARLQQALVDYQLTVLRAAQEVEDSITGFLREEDALVFNQNAVTAGASAVRIALVQYREGATDFQRVLDSQRSLLQSQNGLAHARSAAATNLIGLYKALGGGWELRQGQPVISDSARDEMKKRSNWGGYLNKPPAVQVDQSPSTHR